MTDEPPTSSPAPPASSTSGVVSAASVSPADAQQVAEALARWAKSEFGGQIEVVGEPATNARGLDNYIHFVELAGDTLPGDWRHPLVVRVQQTAERFDHARREAEIQRWASARDFPAPPVLALFAPGELTAPSAQVMPRVPGQVMIEAMVPTVWRVPDLLSRLGLLHTRLHRLPIDDFPSSATDDPNALAERRLGPVRRWIGELGNRDLEQRLEAVERLLPALETTTPSVCHGDFHPLNVLVDADQLWVIDWTDSELGDRHGDIARTQLLFRVASIAAETQAERAALKATSRSLSYLYLRAYGRSLPFDPRQVARWETVHLLNGWGQVLALHAGVIGRDQDRSKVPPALAPWLQQRLDRRLAENH